MRSQRARRSVYHTDSDLFCVWYHVAPCHWLMLPASPPPCAMIRSAAAPTAPLIKSLSFLLTREMPSQWPSERGSGGRNNSSSYFKGWGCSIVRPPLRLWQMPLIRVGDMLRRKKWVTCRSVTHVSHNAWRHLLSTFACNETQCNKN